MNCEELSLRWQDHHGALLAVFENLLRSNTLVDCTLAAEGRSLKAHKVVLSACSPYFQLLFKEESEKHPIIILKDVKFWTLKAVVDFVYCGEVKIHEKQLGAFLEVAESLQIKGLGTGTEDEGEERGESSSLVEPSRETSTSPIPRKRFRRNRSSVSEGDNRVNDFTSHNNNCQYSQLQTESVKASNVSSPSVVSAVSTSNLSSSAVQSNADKFDRNQPSKAGLSSEKSLSLEPTPVVKVEQDTETYQEGKIEFPDEATEEFLEDTSMMNDVDTGPHAEQSNPDVYSDFTHSFVETEDLDSRHPYIPGQEIQHRSLHDLPSSNIETVDLSSDDSSFQLPQREYSNSGAVSFANAVGYSAAQQQRRRLEAAAAAAAAGRPQQRKAYCCADCRKTFPRPSDLLRHRRTHTGERPFACARCGRTFKQREHLRTHERTHEGAPAPEAK